MRPLTITMYRALARVRHDPGQSYSEYGRLPTLRALSDRGLVKLQISGHVEPTDAGLSVHLHAFATTMHLDGCHWYSTVATCECGATYSFYGERSPKDDPYSLIWMEDLGDPDDPDWKPCERCHELIDGARPIYREQIDEPKAKATA